MNNKDTYIEGRKDKRRNREWRNNNYHSVRAYHLTL